jgi:hypothetical protein
VGAERAHALAVEPLGEAEPAQYPRRIRRYVDTAADLGEGRRLFVEVDFEPGVPQRHGGGEAADTAANDPNAEHHSSSFNVRRDRPHEFFLCSAGFYPREIATLRLQ